MGLDIWGKSLKELEEYITLNNFPKFRAKQIHDYLYHRCIFTFDEMKQLPKNMREWLKENASIYIPEVINSIQSNDGNTTKILFKLKDGSLAETVCMHHKYGNSICVSTQIGCAMGCIFCASTRNGLERNLTFGEMLSQVYAFKKLKNISVHSIVLMGAGEPLTNYENCLKFIKLCNDSSILNISYRNITLSTCGIVPQIYRLEKENLPITLAISLHAPNDKIRNEILPSSKHFKIEDVIRASKHYFENTGRRITFEYILIKGINAAPEHAIELAKLVGNLNCHINLIPVNGTEHIQLFAPSKKEIFEFQQILEKMGKSATVRKQMGNEIQAACGQLKRRYLENR